MHKKKKEIKKEKVIKSKKVKIDKTKERAKIIAFIKYFSTFFAIQNFDIKVNFKDETTNGNLAEIIIEEDYQRIKIDVMGDFFKEPKVEQRKALLHELCHYVNWSLYSIAWDLHNGKFYTKDQIRAANEKATCMVELLLDRALTMDLLNEKKEYKKYHGK